MTWPAESDYVKIVCKNGLMDEGHIASFTEQSLILKTEDGLLCIIKPYENIVAIKQKHKPNIVSALQVADTEELKLETPIQDQNLRAKKLVELRLIKAQAERERTHELLTTKTVTKAPEVNFGLPDFTKPISKHPKKKT